VGKQRRLTSVVIDPTWWVVPESRVYYDRKRAQGKTHNQAVRALGWHMVRVVWRTLTAQRDYEPKPTSAPAIT